FLMGLLLVIQDVYVIISDLEKLDVGVVTLLVKPRSKPGPNGSNQGLRTPEGVIEVKAGRSNHGLRQAMGAERFGRFDGSQQLGHQSLLHGSTVSHPRRMSPSTEEAMVFRTATVLLKPF